MTSVSAAGTNPNAFAGIGDGNSRRSAFTQLTKALQSGDLSGAQAAYASLTQAGGGNPNSPFAAALQQIGSALQSGDIGQAQQALSSLQQQMQAGRAHHHGHGHGHADNDGDQQSNASQSTADVSATTSSSPGLAQSNIVNLTA